MNVTEPAAQSDRDAVQAAAVRNGWTFQTYRGTTTYSRGMMCAYARFDGSGTLTDLDLGSTQISEDKLTVVLDWMAKNGGQPPVAVAVVPPAAAFERMQRERMDAARTAATRLREITGRALTALEVGQLPGYNAEIGLGALEQARRLEAQLAFLQGMAAGQS